MNWENRLKATRSIVAASMVLALLSLFTSMKGWGEVYPFFHYKLFTQPIGSDSIYSQYRIYSRPSQGVPFRRNAIAQTRTFDYDGYTFTFSFLVREALHGEDRTAYKDRLLIFCKHVVPNQAEYKIVEEKFVREEILKDHFVYDTSTVIRF